MLCVLHGWEALASPPMALVEVYPVSRSPFKVMTLNFHNPEFQDCHSKHKHYSQVKAQMASLTVTVKPGVREEEQGCVEG